MRDFRLTKRSGRTGGKAPRLALLGGVGATVLALGCFGPAAAQTAPEDPATQPNRETEAEANANQVEEIVVTARKVEERLQDVPLTVFAFTSETLRELGVRDIVDVANQTPGFSMQNNSRTNEQPFIRGMSANSVFRDQQNASFFQDGIYVAGIGRTIGLDDIERVEVLLGPQAVVFGRATFAGAVNYVSRKPTDELEFHYRAELGSNELMDASAGVSGPIIPGKLSFRLFGQLHDYGGEYINLLDGQELGREETRGLSTSLRWDATDDLRVTGRVQYVEIDDGHAPTVVLSSRTNNNCLPNSRGVLQFYCGELRIPDTVALNLNNVPGGGYRRLNQFRSAIFVDYDLGDYRFNLTTAYNYETQKLSTDGDGTPLNAFGGALNALFFSRFYDRTLEARVVSPQQSRFRWLAGASYFDSVRDDSSLLSPRLVRSTLRDTQNYAAFASAAFDVTSQLTATLEGRYQIDEISLRGTPFAETFRSFLPRVIVDYKPVEDVLLYAIVAKGNKPGSFNSAANVPLENITVEEEEIINYEVGAKTSLFDRRLTLNASAYYIDWTNQGYQDTVFQRDARGNLVRAPNGSPLTTLIVVNVGKSSVRGAELDANFQIAPGWSARAAYAYTDSRYDDFRSRLPLAFGGEQQVGGNQLQNTPLHKVTLSTIMRQALTAWPGWESFFSADLTLRDRQFLDELNTSWIAPLTLLNARVGVENGGLSLSLYGRNLTDTDVPDFATRTIDFNTFVNSYQVTLRPGRSFGAVLAYRY